MKLPRVPDEARAYVAEGLQKAQLANRFLVRSLCLSTVADWFAADGQRARAAELAALLQQDVRIGQPNKDKVEHLLDSLKGQMEAQGLTTAIESGRGLQQIKAVWDTVLKEFSG